MTALSLVKSTPNIMLGLLLLALWLAAFSLCIQLFMVARKQPRSKSKSRKRAKPRRRPSRSPQYSSLEVRLVSLLNGDKETARRLTNATRRNHPNRSEQWCQEKALFDLERDRR